MNEGLILSSLLLPLLGAALVRIPAIPGRVCCLILSIFALPALAAAWMLPTETVLDLPWLLMGSSLGLSDMSKPFLLFTAMLWILAGWFSAFHLAGEERFRGYTACFLLSFTGNITLFFARDVPLFYTGFAVMTFAAYGLIVYTRSEEALRAGRLYIGMAVAGEILVLSGLIGLVNEAGTSELSAIRPALAGSPNLIWISGLLLAGFGVKAGLFPLHGWLPLAHPAAPAGASAVLSGAMIKAGLFGWITFLPGGLKPLPELGLICAGIGLFAALAGALAALTQTRPKATLAYSSISQMGLMTVAIGIGLSHPETWPLAVSAVSFYAFNHAFAKGALFMAAGTAPLLKRPGRTLLFVGAVLTSLVIAGAPLTGGEAAKKMIKDLALKAPGGWTDSLELWLIVSTLATTLLLARLIQLLYQSQPPPSSTPNQKANSKANPKVKGMAGVLALAMLAALIVPRLTAGASGLTIKFPPLSLKTLEAAWPIALAAVISPLVLWLVGRLPKVPTGDLGLLFLSAGTRLAQVWTGCVAPRMEQLRPGVDRLLGILMNPSQEKESRADFLERKIRSMPGAGAVLFTLLLLIWWSLQI